MCYCPAEEVGFQKAAPASLRMNVTVFRDWERVLCFSPLLAAIYVWEQEVAARSVGEAIIWNGGCPGKTLNFVNINNLCLEMR